MTRRASFTQSELDRAQKVAESHGKVVEIDRGVIRLVDPKIRLGVTLDECDTDEISRRFGCPT